MTEETISPRMRKLLEKGRTEARSKVIERGIVQFRADPELMAKLLEVSENQRIPLGTMVRNWVAERLEDSENQGASSSSDALAEKITKAVVMRLQAIHITVPEPTEKLSPLCTPASAQFYTSVESRIRTVGRERYDRELEKVS